MPGRDQHELTTQDTSVRLMFDELGEGVFRRRYEALDLNIGVVIGEDGVLVVDTRASHSQADQFKKELSSLTDLPVRWVINTHWHWDHTFGNSRFPDVDLWDTSAAGRRLPIVATR